MVAYQSATDATKISVIEWAPGEWSYTTAESDFCQMLAGCGTFIPNGGVAIPLKAGDAILMHSGTAGRWVVIETLRRLSLKLPRAL
ncbi:cupin domain-containing protein [Mesorhizobium japonicum]